MYAIAIAEGQRKQRANQPSMIDHLAADAALIIAGLSYALRISIHGLAPLMIQYPLIIFASYNVTATSRVSLEQAPAASC